MSWSWACCCVGKPVMHAYTWSSQLEQDKEQNICAGYTAVVRNAEDALPACVECTQRDALSVLFSPRVRSVHACSHQQHPPLHSIIPVILCSVMPSVFHSQTNASQSRWGCWPCTAEYSIACSTCTGGALPPRGVGLGEHMLQSYMPKKCCHLPHHTVRAAVPKRPGLHLESSVLMLTQFLVSFLLPGPWKPRTIIPNWYILVPLLASTPCSLAPWQSLFIFARTSNQVTLNKKVSPLLMLQDFTAAF